MFGHDTIMLSCLWSLYLSLNMTCKVVNWVLKRVEYIKDYYVKISYRDLLCEVHMQKGNVKLNTINKMCSTFESFN